MFIFTKSYANEIAFVERKAARRRRGVSAESPKLVLGIGEFRVQANGISAEFRQPLQRLTNFYRWEHLPFGISAVRALASSEDIELVDRLVKRLGLGSDDMGMLGLVDQEETNLGVPYASTIEKDTIELMSWSFKIAEWCPDESVAAALRAIKGMPVGETDQYVRSFLT